ncbi:cyclase family protein [Ferroacidibacillus organovorans]|uniref:Kynurenine formamidase n=1 Tax=Ferroacidibacillus organovorans TaxID=1765683 RepID=A0A101XNN1_9BACL|nr:cyclase family protein [Ferroacidibacillus organovorans]KUO94769.1 cyclase [Ferroacidibacillus organovorans]
MRFYDVSMDIVTEMAVYKDKDEKRPHFAQTASFSTHGFQETRVSLDVHTGTHVDAPLHMVEGGAPIEAIGLERLVTTCRVLNLTHVEDAIAREDLEPFAIQAGEFLLFQTRNSAREGFDPGFVFLNESGAKYLAEIGIAGVGIDALGIERSQEGHPTHKALFSANVVILEGLRLGAVPPAHYLMVCAPLRLKGVDAAPARVLLFDLSAPADAGA